jgi:hypothetical protein
MRLELRLEIALFLHFMLVSRNFSPLLGVCKTICFSIGFTVRNTL